MSATIWLEILMGVIFALVGLVLMVVIPPMVIRPIYTQLPRRLHRSFGRISAWLMALGLAAVGFALFGVGGVSLLGFIDQRLSARVFAAVPTSGIMLYLLAALMLAVLGMVTFFIGRIVSHYRSQ